MSRQATAVHEAGHAVIGRVLGMVCGEATIVPDNADEMGHAHPENPLHRWKRGDGSRKQLADDFCISLYAGAEAEKLILGGEDVGDGVDNERATHCLCALGIPGAAFVGDDAWERYEDRLHQKAATLVRAHRSKIEIVAGALLQRGTLSSEEIDALVGAESVG
jgi:ATP-dependent Zn protease